MKRLAVPLAVIAAAVTPASATAAQLSLPRAQAAILVKVNNDLQEGRRFNTAVLARCHRRSSASWWCELYEHWSRVTVVEPVTATLAGGRITVARGRPERFDQT